MQTSRAEGCTHDGHGGKQGTIWELVDFWKFKWPRKSARSWQILPHLVEWQNLTELSGHLSSQENSFIYN